MKLLKGLVFVVLVLCAAGYGGYHLFFVLSVPSYTGFESIKGLESEVTVRTDKFGVPHIFADNEQDLFFAQGYITARERLFQMDMTWLAGM